MKTAKEILEHYFPKPDDLVDDKIQNVIIKAMEEYKNQSKEIDNCKSTIRHGSPEEGTVNMSDLSITYCQSSDSNSEDDQFLKIETQDAGGGLYFTINTERWAFDSIDELITIVEDFKKRI